MQDINIGSLRLAIKDILRHQKSSGRSILDAPARVTCRNPDPRCGCRAYQGAPLLAEADVLGDVACLFGFDGRRSQDGRDGAQVGGQVITLALVGLYLVGRIGQGNVFVRFTCDRMSGST